MIPTPDQAKAANDEWEAYKATQDYSEKMYQRLKRDVSLSMKFRPTGSNLLLSGDEEEVHAALGRLMPEMEASGWEVWTEKYGNRWLIWKKPNTDKPWWRFW